MLKLNYDLLLCRHTECNHLLIVLYLPFTKRSQIRQTMPFSHHSHSGQFCPGHAKDTLEEVIQTAISQRTLLSSFGGILRLFRFSNWIGREATCLEQKSPLNRKSKHFKLKLALMGCNATLLTPFDRTHTMGVYDDSNLPFESGSDIDKYTKDRHMVHDND